MPSRPSEICCFMGKPGVEPPCTKRREADKLTCRKHTKMFAKWREETSGTKIFTRSGKKGKRKKKVPTCCRPGCYNERIAPEPYCFACKDWEGSDDA